MKRIILALFLTGCSSFQTREPYQCIAMSNGIIYARWNGDYRSLEDALKDGESIKNRFITTGAVPMDAFVACRLK